MSAQKIIYGRIDCPHCGQSMEVKPDKNGAPFGFCNTCKGQLRTGGNMLRVEAFKKLHPAIAQAMAGGAVVETVTEAPPVTEKKPAKAKAPPVTVTDKKTDEFNLFDGE